MSFISKVARFFSLKEKKLKLEEGRFYLHGLMPLVYIKTVGDRHYFKVYLHHGFTYFRDDELSHLYRLSCSPLDSKDVSRQLPVWKKDFEKEVTL